MLKRLLLLFLFTSFLSNAQDSLFVKLNSNNDYKQLSLYKVKGVQQSYISNVKSDVNTFKFAFPINSEPGIFRIFFDIQNKGFFEILYNEETISVEFDPVNADETAVFSMSKENVVYQTYIQEIGKQQFKLDSIQYAYFDNTDNLKSKENYSLELNLLYEMQNSYEKQAENLMALEYIKANEKYYNPEIILKIDEYLEVLKSHFFDYIQFSSNTLKNSSIFIDKVIEYVFYLNDSEDEKIYISTKKEAINDVMLKIGENYAVKSEIINSLLYAFAGQENVELVVFIENEHYKNLPEAYQNKKHINQINEMIKTAIGSVAPEITWQNNEETKKLSELSGNDFYIIAFWSTLCSHCLQDIPKLYEFTKELKRVKVIAVALEDDAIEFDIMTPEMPNWVHVLGLNKWKNEFARSYDINSTPSFFVLDENKKIIVKPEELEDLEKLFKEN